MAEQTRGSGAQGWFQFCVVQVSARADYALRVAIQLAAASGSHVTGEQLAQAQNIPDKFIETVLTHLRRANIVRSQRGPDGGFWLARPASDICLADIIRAIDGHLPSARVEIPESVTYPGPAEPLRQVWIALRAFGPTVLETVTLADIVSGELWFTERTFTADTACGLLRRSSGSRIGGRISPER
jgi:Rrf2 family protein